MHRTIVALVALGCGLAASIAKGNAQSLAAPTTPCRTIDFSLRSDFNDLGFGPFTCPTDFLSAKGAAVSSTYNTLTGQNSASIDGVATAAYHYFADDYRSLLLGASIGPFVQADYTNLFEPTEKQTATSNTITTGGYAQIALANSVFANNGGEDGIRVRGGQTNGSTGTYYTTFVGEWIPAYGTIIEGLPSIGLRDHIEGTPVLYTFAPELMVQYDHLDGGPNTYLLFSSKTEALRIGPEAVLKLAFDPRLLPAYLGSTLRDFIGNTSAQLTYHASWDDYSGRNYSWSQVSLTYTLPVANGAGHVGITGSYGYGNLETTANMTNQVKLGVSGKF